MARGTEVRYQVSALTEIKSTPLEVLVVGVNLETCQVVGNKLDHISVLSLIFEF